MDKENVIQTHIQRNIIQALKKRERDGNPAICENTDGPWWHIALSEKQKQKPQKNPKQTNS